jgi:hypothetical protein
MARDPAALQLRLLQTVVEVAGEKNSTLVMPVPVELLRFFESMTPGSPPRPAPPLEDTGDAEVAEAEAEIGSPLAAQLPDVPVPELPPADELARPGAAAPGEVASSEPPSAANGPRRPVQEKTDP